MTGTFLYQVTSNQLNGSVVPADSANCMLSKYFLVYQQYLWLLNHDFVVAASQHVKRLQAVRELDANMIERW